MAHVQISVLASYLSVLLGQTALGVILSVWILNLHFRDDQQCPPGPRMRTAAFHMQRWMCKRASNDRVRESACICLRVSCVLGTFVVPRNQGVS